MLLRVLCIACITSAARVEVQADATTAEVREIDFALISAAADGNATEVKRLLDRGADATAKTIPAVWSAVSPSFVLAVASAPLSNSLFTSVAFPSAAAEMRAKSISLTSAVVASAWTSTRAALVIHAMHRTRGSMACTRCLGLQR